MAFLEWISQLEIAFCSNKFTKKIPKRYSTKNKMHKSNNKLIDILIYTVAYAGTNRNNNINACPGQ